MIVQPPISIAGQQGRRRRPFDGHPGHDGDAADGPDIAPAVPQLAPADPGARTHFSRAANLLLAAEFTALSVWYGYLAVVYGAGTDAQIYLRAARLWLGGGDPWSAQVGGVVFAAPPPTLLLYAPFVWVPEALFVPMALLANVGACIFIVRRLKLPWYFVLFPPLVEAALPGNPEPIFVALLVAGHPLSDALAALLKVYGLVPLLLLRRWRSLAIVTAVLALSATPLPWSRFGAELPAIQNALADQSRLGLRDVPFLLPFVLASLWLLGRWRAAWLAVPALWPATQLHYAAMALPAVTPVIAAAAALPLPGAMQLGLCLAGVSVLRQRGRSDRLTR